MMIHHRIFFCLGASGVSYRAGETKQIAKAATPYLALERAATLHKTHRLTHKREPVGKVGYRYRYCDKALLLQVLYLSMYTF